MVFFSEEELSAIDFQFFIVCLLDNLAKPITRIGDSSLSFSIIDTGFYSARNTLRQPAGDTRIAAKVSLPSRVLRDRLNSLTNLEVENTLHNVKSRTCPHFNAKTIVGFFAESAVFVSDKFMLGL